LFRADQDGFGLEGIKFDNMIKGKLVFLIATLFKASSWLLAKAFVLVYCLIEAMPRLSQIPFKPTDAIIFALRTEAFLPPPLDANIWITQQPVS
jgi:hypothetical protein